MLSTALGTLIRPLGLSLRTTWFAMVSGILAITYITWVIVDFGQVEFASRLYDPGWFGLGAAIALAAMVVSFHLRHTFRSPPNLQRLMEQPVTTAELARDPYNRVNLRTLRDLNRLSDDELGLYRLREPYRRHMMMRMSLAEVVAIVGMLVALAGGDAMLTLPFVGGALLMLASAWPNFEAELERAQSLAQPAEDGLSNAC